MYHPLNVKKNVCDKCGAKTNKYWIKHQNKCSFNLSQKQDWFAFKFYDILKVNILNVRFKSRLLSILK